MPATGDTAAGDRLPLPETGDGADRLAAAAALAAPWLYWGVYPGAGTLRLAVVGTAALALLCAAAHAGGFRRLTSPFCLALAAFALWNLLSLSWSADRLASGMRLREALCFCVIAAGFCTAGRALALRAALAGGVLLALGSLAAGWCDKHGWVDFAGLLGVAARHPTGRFAFPFQHPAVLGAALAFPAAFFGVTAGGAALARRWREAATRAACLAPCLLAIELSGTRASLAGTAAGTLGGLFPLLDARGRKALAGICLAALLGGAVCAGVRCATPAQREVIYTGSFGTRVIFGLTALRMAEARPLLGWGAGTFAAVSPSYETQEDLLHGQRGDIVYSTHSEPLQNLAELGLPGLGAWLLAHLLAVAGLLRQRGVNGKIPTEHCALAAGVGALLLDSCGSMSLRFGELPALYAMFLGLAAAQGLPPEMRPPPAGGRRLALAVCAALAAWYAALAAAGVLAELDYDAGLKLAAQGKAVDAENRFSLCMAGAGKMELWVKAAERAALLREEFGDFAGAAALRREMLPHFPGDPVNRNRLVRLLYERGEFPAAFAECISGLRLNRFDRRQDAWLGQMLKHADVETLAVWLARRERDAPALAPAETRWLYARMAYETGSPEAALLLASGLRQEDVPLADLPYAEAEWALRTPRPAAERRSTALALLQKEIDNYPADPRALALAAELLLHSPADQGEAEAGYALLDRAVKLGRGLPQVVRVATAAYIASGDPALRTRAEEIAVSAVAQNPDDPSLAEALIATLWRLGKSREAANELTKAEHRFAGKPELAAFAAWRQRLQPDK